MDVVSAAGMMDIMGSQKVRLYKATPDNWNHAASVMNLEIATPKMKKALDDYMTGSRPYHLYAPQAPVSTLGPWEGFGTIAVSRGTDGLSDYTNVSHIIDGRKGAVCVDDPENCSLDPDKVKDGFEENDSCPRPGAASSDPIDMRQGRFFNYFFDLRLGSGPQAMVFQRSYYSSNNLDDSGMGYGWGHGFSSRLTRQSNGFEGLGKLDPVPAAPALAAIFVTQDLLEAGLNVDKLYLTSMIDAWLTES